VRQRAKEQNMKLRDIVVEKAIVPNMTAIKRDEAVRELLDALVASGRVSAEMRDTFAKAIIARENKGSTGLNHGVAIPHTKSPSIHAPIAAIGVSQAGIDFNSLDKQPVHSVVLLLSPEAKPEAHLEAIQAIFSHLSKDRFRRFLRQARSVSEVMTLLEEADSGQVPA
jgi:mannitol/fructose-specific phosphotransferase system IIA component (Ntr-type)